MANENLPSLLDRHWAESALAIGAVIIAAASLWVAYDANRTNRELVASGSWPYIQVFESDTAGRASSMTFGIVNEGVGPAKLESFELFWKGKPQRNPWQLLLRCCDRPAQGAAQPPGMEALQSDVDLSTSTDEGVVVRAGAKIAFVVLKRNAADAGIWDALHSGFSGNLTVRYCYCSVFDECWVNTEQFGGVRRMDPPRVRSCPRPTVPYDNRALAALPPRTDPGAL